MPFVPAPNIVMIEWRFEMAGANCENRLMVDHLGPPSQANLEGYASGAWSWWENTYSSQINEIATLRETVATDMSSQNGSQAVFTDTPAPSGLVTGGALPNETAFCLSLRSNARGRSARGRWYVGGISDSARADANHITGTVAAAMAANLQSYVDAIEATGKLVVIVSYFTNNNPRVGGPVYFPVTTVTFTDTTLDSMRTRKPGVGS